MKTIAFLASFILSTSVWAATNMDINVKASVKAQDTTAERTVDRYYYNFGMVRMYSTQYIRYTLTNTGTTPLTFDRALIGGPGYDAYHSCTGVLNPNEKCSFEISFSPVFEYGASGRFILSFIENLDIVVDLYGTGTRY